VFKSPQLASEQVPF